MNSDRREPLGIKKGMLDRLRVGPKSPVMPPGEEPLDVGKRLRALRRARDLSQRDLATLAGVTSGTVSLIEQNRHSPSVASLKKLTDALGITFSDFFALQLKEPRKIFFAHDEITCLTEGLLRFSVVAGERREKALQILYEVYRPGGDTGPEMLCHPGEEGGIVLSGSVEVIVGDRTRVLHPGDSYYFDSDIPHRFRNIGAGDAIIVSACTPPSL